LTSKEERQRWPRRLYAGIQTDSDRKLLLGRGAYLKGQSFSGEASFLRLKPGQA